MGRKDCSQEYLISAYLDGELSDDAAVHFERHLADCSHCSDVYKNIKANDQLLALALPEMEAPENIKIELFKKIDAGPETQSVFEGIRRLFSLNYKTWAYACAPVLLIAVIISALHVQQRIENGRILAQIDHSRSEWVLRDKAANPFNIDVNGAPLRLAGKNPFEAYLNER